MKILLFGLAFSALHIALERGLSFAVSDIALSAWVRILNIGIILCDAVGFLIGYALLQALALHGGKRQAFPALVLLVAVSVFRHIGNWGVFLLTDKVSSAVDLRLSFLAALSALIIEFVQHAAIFLLTLPLLNKEKPTKSKIFPAAATVAVTMLVINLLSRILADIEYGAPSSSAEVWVMIGYYLFDVLLYGVVGFFTIQAILNRETNSTLF